MPPDMPARWSTKPRLARAPQATLSPAGSNTAKQSKGKLSMDIYVKLAMRTCAPGDNLLHCTLGLVTEAAEIASAGDQVEMKEEMGDLMWYVAVGCDHFGVTMWEAIDAAPAEDPRDGLTLIGDFANQVKRLIFYKNPLDPAVMISLLGEIIISLKMD